MKTSHYAIGNAGILINCVQKSLGTGQVSLILSIVDCILLDSPPRNNLWMRASSFSQKKHLQMPVATT